MSGRLLRDVVIRTANYGDWPIYEGAVRSDERFVAVSYHGTSATGIDWLELRPRSIRRCPGIHSRGVFACLGTHGGVSFDRNSLLATLGEPAHIVHYNELWSVTKRTDTRLERNHFMEFAVSAPGETLSGLDHADTPVG